LAALFLDAFFSTKHLVQFAVSRAASSVCTTPLWANPSNVRYFLEVPNKAVVMFKSGEIVKCLQSSSAMQTKATWQFFHVFRFLCYTTWLTVKGIRSAAIQKLTVLLLVGDTLLDFIMIIRSTKGKEEEDVITLLDSILKCN